MTKPKPSFVEKQAEVKTVNADLVFADLRQLFTEWKNEQDSNKKEGLKLAIVTIIHDLKRYYGRGLWMPFKANVLKKLDTQLEELNQMLSEVGEEI